MKCQKFLISVFCILVVTAQIAQASSKGKQQNNKSSTFNKIVDFAFDILGLPKQLSSIKDVVKLASAGLFLYTTYSENCKKDEKQDL